MNAATAAAASNARIRIAWQGGRERAGDRVIVELAARLDALATRTDYASQLPPDSVAARVRDACVRISHGLADADDRAVVDLADGIAQLLALAHVVAE